MGGKVEAAIAGVTSVVPSLKQMVWLVVIGGTTFLAGIGFKTEVLEYEVLPAAVDSVKIKIDSIVVPRVDENARLARGNAAAISALEARLQRESAQTQSALNRIRCLAALSATGQTVNPLRIDDVCP